MAFQVTKSHTTPYHPIEDELVKKMNRSLLDLLRTFTQKGDWEQHLQLLCTYTIQPSTPSLDCLLMK